jgi:hypothetical protein
MPVVAAPSASVSLSHTPTPPSRQCQHLPGALPQHHFFSQTAKCDHALLAGLSPSVVCKPLHACHMAAVARTSSCTHRKPAPLRASLAHPTTYVCATPQAFCYHWLATRQLFSHSYCRQKPLNAVHMSAARGRAQRWAQTQSPHSSIKHHTYVLSVRRTHTFGTHAFT